MDSSSLWVNFNIFETKNKRSERGNAFVKGNFHYLCMNEWDIEDDEYASFHSNASALV